MYSLDYANASGWHDNVHFACGSDTLQRPYIIEWSADCNGDGIVDYGQILDGTLSDEDGNGVPDCCENGDCLNLVENGSFEQGPALNECSWHWIDVAGNNAIPGWTVTSQSVARFRIDQDDTGCLERWRSFSGRHSLDLDGEGPGTIRTSIDTIPGEYYRLTFELTGNCDQAPNERGTAVTIGSTTRTFIHQCEFDGDEPWSTHAWMFRASDATTDIAFASLSNQGSRNGAVIDLVTVMSAGAPINVPAEYPTIQGAIDNAPAGAIIEVDPGTYGPFDLAADDLTIRSTGGAGVTRITTGLGGRGLIA
ncbi:MAG: DUF642 domain-containing protein, partial [Planctomycetota bacterium]|nr:DUF642 domain-containing protein [Planctomycetota bacterium]